MKRQSTQPKVRSAIAVQSFLRPGAGKHGGSARAQARKARKATKQSLKKGDYDY